MLGAPFHSFSAATTCQALGATYIPSDIERSDTHVTHHLATPIAEPGARIVVAMSGGVDSSVAAALCKQAGYNVIGVTLQLYDDGAVRGRAGTCCAGQDIHDARRVAASLDIPHYVLDYEARFRESVINPFAESYIRGETPIPCVSCNQTVKFRDLLTTAKELGASCLVTGHYVRRLDGKSGPELYRALDQHRDQSYFLFGTTRGQLEDLRFPLGEFAKNETREMAARFELPVAAKPDSQDICFVPQGRYADIVAKLRPGMADPGDIVDLAGSVLGQHEGIIHYTVGQRRGLSLGGGKALYVVRIDVATNRIVVGPKAALTVGRIRVRNVNWLGDGAASASGIAAMVKVRSTQPGSSGRLFDRGSGMIDVELDTGDYGVAPGQAAVFYDGDRVLGGGWIAATEPPLAPTAAQGSATPPAS